MIIMYFAISHVNAGGKHHRHVTIHVPLQIKQHHHTHTIYKHIKHHDRGYWPRDDVHSNIGYVYGGEGGNGGYGHFGGHYGPSSFEGGWGGDGGGGFGGSHGYLNNHYDESNWIDDK